MDAFHVLAADIEDAVDLRLEKGGGVVVGDRLHFAFVEHQGRLNKGFAVTGGAGISDLCALRQQPFDFGYGLEGGRERASIVA